MKIVSVDISMNEQLQELLESIYYISEYSGVFKRVNARDEIEKPELPKDGKLENNKQECVYNDSGEMINYCQYYINYKDESTVFIGDFYIKRNYQKKGFGKKCLGMFENQWKELGFKKVILNVDIKNWAAIQFWINNGYDKIIKWIGDKEYLINTFAMIRLEKHL
jgi:ribosomal protein S18 acetylase RimI-like enzyme